ncbi:hypothetical protein L3X38_024753 [Prunus dulcis]|uniref:Uncharacterized protein n=1 Tax=Prunus dulcis TaxID=3755 RepID=A0AAD4W0C8_PRUDU|nr:hypothetical protein L3X38_024753 [Prunus dulcis]
MLCSGKTTNFSAAQEEYCDTNTSQIFHFFPPESSQSKSDRLNEEETDEILPSPETFSAPVPHQSHVEDVIQEADDLDIPHGFAGDNERHVVDTIGSMVDRIPGAFPSLPAAIIDSTQDVDKVGSATQGAEGTLPALPPLERPGATTYTVLAALGPEHSILPHLPATLPCSEITDGDCQIGGTSVESALVGHLLEKSLSWLDWESCFIAFKAFFDSGVKILRSIDELLPLCHRFNSYVTFRGAFLYPETIEVLGRFMDRYGGFMESTWTVSTFSRSAALRGLGLVLHGIDTMQLLDIIDHRLLCWRDAICEAITLGFHVDFLLDLLRNPAHAIFGVRAILNLMR